MQNFNYVFDHMDGDVEVENIEEEGEEVNICL